MVVCIVSIRNIGYSPFTADIVWHIIIVIYYALTNIIMVLNIPPIPII